MVLAMHHRNDHNPRPSRPTSSPSTFLLLFLLTLHVSFVASSTPIGRLQWINLGSIANAKGDAPSARRDFAIGYDAKFSRVVVFGGRSATGAPLGDTIIFDILTQTWRPPLITSSATPAARHSMAYGIDSPANNQRNNLIIALGSGPSDQSLNDVWAFDFNYEEWKQLPVNNTSAGPNPMYNVVSGIDTTKDGTAEQTMWITMGTNGSAYFTDVWGLTISGEFSHNVASMAASWTKVSNGTNVGGGAAITNPYAPTGRADIGGTLVTNNRLVIYGGQNGTNTADHYLRDGYALTISTTGTQSAWKPLGVCPSPRRGAAMAMHPLTSIPQFANQAVLFGGVGGPFYGNGRTGEVALVDIETGDWQSVIPAPDSASPGYPPPRAGAGMVTLPKVAIGSSTTTAADILVFGGQQLVANADNGTIPTTGTETLGDMLADFWILRIWTDIMPTSNTTTTTTTATTITTTNTTTSLNPSEPPTASIQLLQCPTATLLTTPTGSNSSTPDGILGQMPMHAAATTAGIAALPLAVTLIRFSVGHRHAWIGIILYLILYGCALGLGVYGLMLGYHLDGDIASSATHFATDHGRMGLAVALVALVGIPLLSIVIWGTNKFIERSRARKKTGKNGDVALDDDGAYEWDANEGSRGDKWWKGEMSSVAGKKRNSSVQMAEVKMSFEVSRPQNRLGFGLGNGTGLHPHDLGNGGGSITGNRSSIAGSEAPSLYSPSAATTLRPNLPVRDHSFATSRTSSTVLFLRHAHHIIAHTALLFVSIFVAYTLYTASNASYRTYAYGFIAYVAILYLAWIVAAWYGYPRSRGSLLVRLLRRAGGRGEIHAKRARMPLDGVHVLPTRPLSTASMSDNISPFTRNSVTGPRRPIAVRGDGTIVPGPGVAEEGIGSEDDTEVDRQMEQEMAGRDVVVMTIPKRKLQVVNA
ncbi:hypothetical protein BC938DRAFT_475596 [Jimgerdemannia flammicorona]|uniref:Galactose oxidase n=1 Tax=Jimgerdemannia flammicorona TaxID=994334 RepID=A0A433PRR5_9FUNG|nr:hypothetical protein BC938DRAFT_475596 [Jimgerdemannia flammicorona]